VAEGLYESTDQAEAVATLLRIAHWMDAEARASKENSTGSNSEYPREGVTDPLTGLVWKQQEKTPGQSHFG
jgi:hypothetical protein